MKKPYLLPRFFQDTMPDNRFDFRGGRNSAAQPDQLNPNELQDCTNARVDAFGSITKRTGTQRMHTTALGGAVKGIFQWNGANGYEVIAIANGLFYHKTSPLGDFTSIDPGVGHRFDTASPTTFATFRLGTANAPLVLYMASNGRIYSWDGTTLTDLTGTLNRPDATILRSYHTRLFANSISLPKSVYWSGVGTTDFTPSTSVAGGAALVDVLSGDKVVAMDTLGGSLLIATKDAIVRYTGYSANDIQIAQDTEGVSSEVGCVGALALYRAEQVVYLMSDKGPYMAVEAGVQPIGMWVEADFDGMDMTQLVNVTVGHHGGRREVWFAYSATGDTQLNKHVLVYSLRLQRWVGPFVYPFGITCFTEFIDAVGDLYIIAGCSDGFVRHLDTGALDDVLANSTGGSVYNMNVVLAPFFYQDGPGYTKRLAQVFLQANLESGHNTLIGFQGDAGAYTYLSPTATLGLAQGTTLGVSMQSYRLLPYQMNKRINIAITDNSNTIPIIGGLSTEAIYIGRPS